MELVILFPAFLLLLFLTFAAGRVLYERDTVSNADQDAARAASISRTPGAAAANARAAALDALRNSGLQCRSTTVNVDTADFSVPITTIRPVTRPLTVTVTVSCTVSLSDLLIPGLPGSHSETYVFTSVVDQYRER